MSQQEVLDFLKENKGQWFTSKQIMANLDVDCLASATNSTRKLREAGYIHWKKELTNNRYWQYLYKYKP